MAGPQLTRTTVDEDDLTDLRGVLYGLHAILRLHTVQEDETYLSLGDSTDAVAATGAPAGPHGGPAMAAAVRTPHA